MTASKRPRTKAELAAALRKMAEGPYDPEAAHGEAEDLLLAYINDPEVTAAYNAMEFWYA